MDNNPTMNVFFIIFSIIYKVTDQQRIQEKVLMPKQGVNAETSGN
jgi:hypothetical protein